MDKINTKGIARDGTKNDIIFAPIETKQKDRQCSDKGKNRVITIPNIVPDATRGFRIHVAETKQPNPANHQAGNRS